MYKDPIADWEKVKPLKIIVLYRPIVDSISFVVKENGEFRHFRYNDDYYLLETLGTIDVKDIQADIAAGEVITVSYRYGQLGKKLKGFKDDFYVYYTKLK